jgi:hypothetical protein
MDDEPHERPLARDLPLWKRIGRALQRSVWPIAGAKDDPWLRDGSEDDPDLARPEKEEPPPQP